MYKINKTLAGLIEKIRKKHKFLRLKASRSDITADTLEI